MLMATEVAAMLRVDRSTIYRLCREGSLPHTRLSPRCLRIPADALRAYLGAA